MIRTAFLLLGLFLLAALIAAPAAGDWLVLRDGTRLETEGPWEVKGRQVVFTRPGGALAALRLADVDLDASAAATAAAVAAAAAAAAAPPPAASESVRRSPVLVLTDDDLRPGGAAGSEPQGETLSAADEEVGDQADAGDAGDGGQDEDGEQPAAAGAGGSQVVIVSWREQESNEVDGLEITGSVRNQGRDVAADIQVQVKVSDEDGGFLADNRAFLERSSLAPGRTTTFRALLPGIYTLLEDPTFEVTSEGFALGLAEEVGADDEFAAPADEFAAPADELGDDELAGGELEDFADEQEDLEPLDERDDEGGGGSRR